MNTLQYTTSNKGFQVSGLAFKTSQLETNVTKSVGELDDIKKTVRSISGTVTTVQNEVKELSKKYVDLETHTQGMSSVLFISFRSNLKAFRSSDSDSMCVQILILS
jgi:uncharacterized protein YoxC